LGWRERFLVGLEHGFSVAAACRAAGISRGLVYRERRRSTEFAIGWELAVEAAEAEASSLLLHREMARLVDWQRLRKAKRAGCVASSDRVGRFERRLRLRVSDAELGAWQTAARAAGLSVSELVRRFAAPKHGGCWSHAAPLTSWRTQFIRSLRASGNVSLACRQANVRRGNAYAERDRSPAFALAWECARDELEDEWSALNWKLAMGIPTVSRKVRHNADGTQTVTVRITERTSVAAMMRLLKHFRPEYR
jgi:hypothetical protein